MAEIISGREISKQIKQELSERVQELAVQGLRVPAIAVVLVGTDPASVSYVRGKHKACAEIGIRSEDINLEESVSEQELCTIIRKLNADDAVDGILVQLPLPPHISEKRVTELIDPEKDVDGFHPINLGRLMSGNPSFLPCTPNGIIEMLKRTHIQTEGKHVCIVGRSNIVGKPLANMLMLKNSSGNATVTVCHSRTADLEKHTLQADILIAAMGKPGFITADMIAEGAVVIDVGVNRVDDASRKRGYRLVGDVQYDEAAEKASYITPVPGGVGPMTIAMLMQNTLMSYEMKRKQQSE